MKGCIGGTFDRLHLGHMRLFEEAFNRFDHLVVGITSDRMAADSKTRKVRPFRERERSVVDFLLANSTIPFEIVPLKDPYGPAIREEMEGIVVSKETEEGARRINRLRGERGITPLTVFVVDLLTVDGRKVSSKDYDTDEAVRVILGSDCPEKRKGTVKAFLRFYPLVDVRTVPAEPPVPELPKEKEVSEGAYSRALQARQEAEGDFFVGIESGLASIAGKTYNIHVAHVIGPDGFNSSGASTGFLLPEGVLLKVEEGADLREATERLRMETDGKKKGTADVLSKGILTRERLCEEAVLSALIPLKNPELFGKGLKTWPLTDPAHRKERKKLSIDWK